MLQSNIVILTGVVTGVAGIIANLKYYGPKQALLFALLLTILVYFAYYQVVCLVKGSCIVSSWFSAVIAIMTFSGIGAAYYYAIKAKTQPMINKRFLESNPWVAKTASYIATNYKYTLLN